MIGADVKCFTPSHFDEAQIEFAQRACSAYIWNIENRKIYDNTHLPIPGEVEGLQGQAMESANVPKPMQLYYWFIIEIVIIFAGYMLTRLVTLCLLTADLVVHHIITITIKNKGTMRISLKEIDSEQETSDEMNIVTKQSLVKIANSRLIFTVYLIVEVLLLLIWLGLSTNAVLIQSQRQKVAGADTSNVMCEFNLSNLGNNQQYVTQCQLPLMNSLAMVSVANSAMCFTVALLLLINILYMAFIAPFLSKGPMDSILKQVGVKPLSAAFSDLTLLPMLQEHIYH